MKQLVISIAVFAILQTAMAEEKRFKVYKENSDQRATLVNSRPLSLYYQKISWNQEPTEIETGLLYLRDRDTGELTELKLTETKPNSAIFNIDFAPGTLSTEKVAAEVYSAPQEMLKGNNRKTVIEKLIEDKSVKRKPFLLRVLRSSGQVVDIFDNKTDAIAAYNYYRKQMGLSPESKESESIIEVANKEKPTRKKVIDTSTLQSLFLANENDMQATNEKNKELREVLRAMELKRRNQVKENAKLWSSSDTSKSKRKAKNHIQAAVEKTKKQKYKQAVDGFFKASNLTPFKEDVYQQYGISLFRDQKYNQSIVVLEISEPSQQRQVEKNFYLAMNYYQMKDYENAVKYFDKVIEANDSSFGPTASFYKGSALVELKEFDKAKQAFQYVLDNSKNPEMDKRAEKFIEYSLDRKALEKKRSNWYFVDGTLGLIYDSNIILATDQAREQGTVTDEAGWRFLAQFNPQFRPYYSDENEVRISLDVTAMQSLDEDFSRSATAETADPYLLGVSVPWTHRGTLGGKGYFFDLIPGYETIIMDLDGTGAATITNSTKVDFNHTLVMTKDWIAKGDWSFAFNDSNILGDETSADSVSGGLKLSSIFILNKDQERYLIPEFSYRINDAKGADFHFNRIDLAVTFTTAAYGRFMWNSRIAYYLANYKSNRTDNNYTLSTGVSTRLSTHWSWNLMGSYIVNDSTTNPYNKFNIASTFSFSY